MTLDRFLDANTAAAMLGIARASLYAYVSRGLIQARPDVDDPRRSVYRAADIARLAKTKARGRKPEQIAGASLDWGPPALSSGITLIEDNRLFYRGRDAVELAKAATVEDAARLLWQCEPNDPFADTSDLPAPAMAAGAHPIDRCLALLAERGVNTRMIWQRDIRRLWPEAATLLRLMAAGVTGTATGPQPIHLQMAHAWGVGPADAEIIRAAMVLLADHESNASAFAVRVVASTGASLTACLLGGLGALSGPLHGGTTSLVEILFDEAERIGDATRVVEERLRRGDRLPGFGHPLYPGGDPRARALLALLPADPTRAALIAAMDEIGRRDPNIDFALVSACRALRLAAGSALALFAVGRTVGWIAHALEQQQDGTLIRPRARYVGPQPVE
ncbi:citrate synthase [Phreatobacter stygius]|uniref:citrate synthase (unknown stereospecificity) n=1 Tax=Phreatobacter stygius TaxID=1940610 RepID=A0A4D7B4G4_9HYPH|nr:citrate synthase [Phreatobacter stygius]QCI64940.1 citrate synthase [Phreatobacter stygius]